MGGGAVDLTSDPQAAQPASIFSKKKESCDKFCNLGYKVNIFRMKLDIKEVYAKPGKITAKNSSERRKALVKAQTDIVYFKATGGIIWHQMTFWLDMNQLKGKKKIWSYTVRRRAPWAWLNEKNILKRWSINSKFDAIMIDDPYPI